MKFCSMCGTEKPYSEFYANRKQGGYQSRCKDCDRKRNAEVTHGSMRRAARDRTEEEREADYVRLRAKTDGLKRCRSCHQWKGRDDYQVHVLRADGRSDDCRECVSAKRMPQALIDYWEEWDLFSCAYCGKPFEEVEHVIPRALGGTNDPRNLVPSCVDCNRGPGGKHDMSPVEWMRLRFPELLEMPVVFEITLTPSELSG